MTDLIKKFQFTDIIFKETEPKSKIKWINKNQGYQCHYDRCDCCFRHFSEVNPYGGPGDPMVGDYTGIELLKIYRRFAPYDEEAEEIFNEAGNKYLNDGFEDVLDWVVDKYGGKKASEIWGAVEAHCHLVSSYECRDCVILGTDDYFDKRNRCYDEWTKKRTPIKRLTISYGYNN